MPYGKREVNAERRASLDALHELIREAVEGVSLPGGDGRCLQCVRGDHDARPGEIVQGIIEELVHSEIAIAVLSGANSNVYYELGVRHAVNNNTLLLAENLDEVPFDLRPQRVIIYSNDLAGANRLRQELRTALRRMLESTPSADNPVRRYLVKREEEKIQAPGRPPGLDVANELLREFARLREDMANQSKHMHDMRSAMVQLMASRKTSSVQPSRELDFLEGCWLVQPSNTHAYIRKVREHWISLYCYGGDDSPTGIYYDFHLVGEQVFAKFKWLESHHIHGFAMLSQTGKNSMKGGWWYEDAPQGSGWIGSVDPMENPAGMVATKWLRQKSSTFPAWAENWYAKVEQAGLPFDVQDA